MNYQSLIQKHLRLCIRDILLSAKNGGFEKSQHALITFSTHYPGVDISAKLKEDYIEEMTIILQHEFWELDVSDHQFIVVLSFDDVYEKIIVPFDAIIEYRDDSENIEFIFDLPSPSPDPNALANNIIRLDDFRKK
jgi:hypothetical protein